MYTSFLSGTVQFFIFTLHLFTSLLSCSLWCGQWWDILLLCCLSNIVYSLSLNLSDQVIAGMAHVQGRGTAEYKLREGGELHPIALTGCVVSGVVDSYHLHYSHWVARWIFTQLACILFYCQIIMTIFSKYNKKIVTDYSFKPILHEVVYSASVGFKTKKLLKKCKRLIVNKEKHSRKCGFNYRYMSLKAYHMLKHRKVYNERKMYSWKLIIVKIFLHWRWLLHSSYKVLYQEHAFVHMYVIG